jgi:adenylate cyclase
MDSQARQPEDVAGAESPSMSLRLRPLLLPLYRRRPFLYLVVWIALSNVFGSAFNITYNMTLIVQHMDEAQKAAFQDVALPLYNLIAYPACLGLALYLVLPLRDCLRDLRAGQEVAPPRLERCRLRLLNLPFYIVFVNGLGWAPGAVFFPLIVCWLGGPHDAGVIWLQFVISFLVSTLLTSTQTFFAAETYLIDVLYPEFFRGARPADVPGVWRIPFRQRMWLLWLSVSFMPLIALGVVTLNADRGSDIKLLAVIVFFFSLFTGGYIFLKVGTQLLGWLRAHTTATEQIREGNFAVRISHKRPDEWGQMTDAFNEMAADLRRGKETRETLGQFINPRVRDEILPLYKELEGEVKEITVMFADIRGFTRRSAGEEPGQVVALLNRFLTLAVVAVEGKGGVVNKFLGDGFMALFNLLDQADHADLAVRAALDLLARLDELNRELQEGGQAPLAVGIGIHTGPALVGSIGARVPLGKDKVQIRKEITAIGETVNLCQRIEQATKTCGGPILVSEQTQARLRRPTALCEVGPQDLPGCRAPVRLYRVAAAEPLPVRRAL